MRLGFSHTHVAVMIISLASIAVVLSALTASNPPSITTQPVSQTVTAGQTATFLVAATGTAPLRYQWKKNGKSITGATYASYTTPVTKTSDSGAQFTVVVSNSVGTVTSSAAVLTVNTPPSITTQPVSQTVTAGQTATFLVTATGTAPLSYQWQENGAPITGATSASYTTPAITSSDSGAQFTVVVSNSVGMAISNSALLIVTIPGPLSISMPSVNFANVNVGSNISLQVQLSNSGSASVTFLSVAISGPGFGCSGISTGQFLPAGQTAIMTVNFSPAATGNVTGSISITSSAINSPTIIALSGSGVQIVSHTADLTWSASTSDVAGYNIYQSAVSGGPYTLLNASPVSTVQYLDPSVQAGQTYYYVVTAVDLNGVESTYSNEAEAVVPIP
jgi:Abnormal spindle-like microcephaly-assoc'd, ASPM-SPD-2-Hydin/Immunoglobulin domain